MVAAIVNQRPSIIAKAQLKKYKREKVTGPVTMEFVSKKI